MSMVTLTMTVSNFTAEQALGKMEIVVRGPAGMVRETYLVTSGRPTAIVSVVPGGTVLVGKWIPATVKDPEQYAGVPIVS